MARGRQHRPWAWQLLRPESAPSHVRRERWPAWIAWRGCERARRGVYRTREEGGRRGHAVTQIGRARTLTGGVVEASVIPSSPLTVTESPRLPRAHGPPRRWCASRPPAWEPQWDRFRPGSAGRRWFGGSRRSSRWGGGSTSRLRETA